MDRPALRNEIIFTLAVKSSHRCGTELCSRYDDCNYCLADQLLVFIPGVEEVKKQVFKELEKQLFRDKPIKDEVCHLTWDMWQALKKEI